MAGHGFLFQRVPKTRYSSVRKDQEIEPDIGVDNDIHESIKMSTSK